MIKKDNIINPFTIMIIVLLCYLALLQAYIVMDTKNIEKTCKMVEMEHHSILNGDSICCIDANNNHINVKRNCSGTFWKQHCNATVIGKVDDEEEKQ